MARFKPMLAVNIKPQEVKKPTYGSLKLEGVRGEVTPEGLLTRSLKPFNNSLIEPRMDAIIHFCELHDIILEGEFYLHGWDFKRIDSCLRGDGNIDANQLEFHVFDCYIEANPSMPFKERISAYKWCVKELNTMGWDFIKACEQTLMSGADDILAAYEWAIANGYEGFCLKAADHAYKLGRSTLKEEYFVRIKPEDDYDCVVLNIIERQHNLCESETNELGYLAKRQDKDMKQGAGIAQTAIVYTPSLNRVHKVSLTRGLTDVDRARIWDERETIIGTPMAFVGIPVPGNNIPRSPRFDKWRHDIQVDWLSHAESDCILASWDPQHTEECCNNGCDLIPKDQWFDLWNRGAQLGLD